MSNFPITINPTEEGFEEKVKTCMGFLRKDIVESIIYGNRKTCFIDINITVEDPAILVDKLVAWYSPETAQTDWLDLHYALVRFYKTGELDQKYLRQETLQKRTILL